MTYIPDELLIEQFLFVPSLSLYRFIQNKNLALKLLFGERKTKNIIEDMNKYDIQFLINIGYFDDLTKPLIELAAEKAAFKGYKNIVNDMIKRGIKNYDIIAEEAAVGGNKDIVDDMVKRGAWHFDWIARGAWHFDWIARGAAKKGHKEIVDDMIEKGANDYNPIASGAAEGGHKEIVDDMIKRDANNFNYIIYHAEIGGYKNSQIISEIDICNKNNYFY